MTRAQRSLISILWEFRKRIFIIGLVLLAIGGGVWAGYFFGDQRGFHRALILQAGTYVVTLDALDKIRAGDIDASTKSIESLCFASANIVYGDFVFRNDFAGHFVAQSMIEDLKHYRQTYRTNSAKWTPMERDLERNLASWK